MSHNIPLSYAAYLHDAAKSAYLISGGAASSWSSYSELRWLAEVWRASGN